MSPEAQRIAIAEACPSVFRILATGEIILISENRVTKILNDLNAMHEAEKVLNAKQSDAYFRKIVSWSTAAQRAEAFLRTLGLWKERDLKEQILDAVFTPL